MFLNYCILNIFDYICAQNAQCLARITKSNMGIHKYNRLKAAAERERRLVPSKIILSCEHGVRTL